MQLQKRHNIFVSFAEDSRLKDTTLSCQNELILMCEHDMLCQQDIKSLKQDMK